MTRKITIGIFSFVCMLSCNDPQADKAKEQQAEQKCAAVETVDKLDIDLQGYAYNEIDSINICVGRSGKQHCYTQKVNERVNDSARLSRSVVLQQQFNIKDTVTIQLKSGKQYKVYGFQYQVQPHYSMGSHEYGCDLYGLTIDGKKQEGGVVTLVKEGFELNKAP